MTSKGASGGKMVRLAEPCRDSWQLPVAEPARAWRLTLATLQIRSSAGEVLVPPPSGLIQRFNETDRISTKKKLPIQFVGYRSMFRGSLVYEGRASDWAIMNLTEDPFYRDHNNWLYAPRQVISDIQRYDALGLRFDAIFIAHELPKGSVRPGSHVPFELLAPPPRAAAQRRLEFLEKSSLSVWEWIAKLVGTAAKAPAVAVTALAAAIARDPILFGVQFDPTWKKDLQPIGLWYYLTHWYWSDDEG